MSHRREETNAKQLFIKAHVTFNRLIRCLYEKIQLSAALNMFADRFPQRVKFFMAHVCWQSVRTDSSTLPSEISSFISAWENIYRLLFAGSTKPIYGHSPVSSINKVQAVNSRRCKGQNLSDSANTQTQTHTPRHTHTT